MEPGGLQSSQFSFRPPMWSLERALNSKAHSCKQQLVEGLISIKQAPGLNSRMTRVTTLRRGSSCQSPGVQCPRYPCKLEKQWRLVKDELQAQAPQSPFHFRLLKRERERKENQMAHFFSAARYAISNHFCPREATNERQLRTSQWQREGITQYN